MQLTTTETSVLVTVMIHYDLSCCWNVIKSSQPEWCISSMICSGDTPFWSGTLVLQLTTTETSALVAVIIDVFENQR